ncbi:hypothetical protein KEU06_02285 [Pseudaminobacter sp. 19-2017]|uniref:Uncharacterized protein n=2 Tax=Pseudaminobacter soli (ex Zhang et al. 2022) TaxID=2831468 RepID=A0A942DVY0_9HYPH|nr:hypothetical protein [Pseudaminobacter soli]
MPSLRTAVLGALLWASVMAASAAFDVLIQGWQTPSQIIEVAILYAVGAAIAFPFAYALTRLVAGGRHLEARLAAALLCFTAVTIGTTALVYALDYRTYYAAWHAEALSIRWFFEFAFTILGALVQFVVSGVRLYFPIGFVGLLAVSCWFARHAR